jgi:hypothetical protein
LSGHGGGAPDRQAMPWPRNATGRIGDGARGGPGPLRRRARPRDSGRLAVASQPGTALVPVAGLPPGLRRRHTGQGGPPSVMVALPSRPADDAARQ